MRSTRDSLNQRTDVEATWCGLHQTRLWHRCLGGPGNEHHLIKRSIWEAAGRLAEDGESAP